MPNYSRLAAFGVAATLVIFMPSCGSENESRSASTSTEQTTHPDHVLAAATLTVTTPHPHRFAEGVKIAIDVNQAMPESTLWVTKRFYNEATQRSEWQIVGSFGWNGEQHLETGPIEDRAGSGVLIVELRISNKVNDEKIRPLTGVPTPELPGELGFLDAVTIADQS